MKKKKNRKLLAITTALSMIAISGGIVYGYTEYQKPQVAKAVEYDDEEYSITLSANEANNYVFNNLNNYLITTADIATDNITFTYDNMVFTTTDSQYSSNTDNKYWYFSASKNVDEDYEYNIRFNVEDEIGNNKFFIAEYIEDYITQYESDLIITIANSFYEDFKFAIELDIAANQPQTDMGSSIIESITSGLGIITDLAAEFLAGFGTLFWNSTNSTLTNFGIFALVMLGIAISFAVIRLIMALIRGNTGV